MADGDADLDLAAAFAKPAAAAPSRFRPKPKGKPKAEPPDPLPPPPPPPSSSPKVEQAVPNSLPDVDHSTGHGAAPMEVDEAEDPVVREIDVFFTPSPLEDGTSLYVMQYPLRPSWRPYELSERCDEVRVKPKQSQIEIDLSVDLDSESCDVEMAEHLRLQKQVLSSSVVSCATEYAVGILRGNRIHLNPIDAVLQLRPSVSCTDMDLQKRKNTLQQVEVEGGADKSKNSSLSQGKAGSGNSNESGESSESWIPLEFHSMDSFFSGRYREKMAANEDKQLDFAMMPSDYLISLCAGASTENKNTRGPPRRVLLALPLEQRLKKLFTEVSEVNRFDALMHLAPNVAEREVLKVLQLYADLVRGLWVCKSSLLFEDIEACARDYILLLFTKKRSITKEELKNVGSRMGSDRSKIGRTIGRIISPLARHTEFFDDYKFKEPVDESFIKRYPDIVREQESAWSTRVSTIMDSLFRFHKHGAKNLLNSNVSKGMTSSSVDTSPNMSKGGTVNVAGKALTLETRKFLREALSRIFKDQKVRSLKSIIRDLRELAKRQSALPKDRGKNRALISAATIGSSLTATDLHKAVIEVADYIHDVYILKSDVEDSLRNAFIKYFIGKEANAKVKKQELLQAASILLKRDITESEYNQVVNELCNPAEEGCLTLRNGD